jgi:hypothetical protein
MPPLPARTRSLPSVERRFEASRLQAQFVAAAYETLIPILRQPLPSEPDRDAIQQQEVIPTSDPQAIGA